MSRPAVPAAALRAACEAARRVDCPACAAMAAEECVFTTAPVSVPVVPGTPVDPVHGYHAARFGHGLITAGDLAAVTAGLDPAAIVWDNGDTPRQPASTSAGPFDTERQARETPAVQAVYDAYSQDHGVGKMAPHCRNILEAACAAAGVDLGRYDDQILSWLSQWEPATCVVIAGLITRASQPTDEPGRHVTGHDDPRGDAS